MWRACALPVFAVAIGCLPWQKNSSSSNWLERSGLFAAADAGTADKAILHTVLVEQPAGDPYLTTELWRTVGQPLAPATAALLAENGIRVARIEGNPPPAFLKLVTAETTTVRPNQASGRLGEAKMQPVLGPVSRLGFSTTTEIAGPATPFDLTDAECGLAVTPAAGDAGRLKLTFEPRVQHGVKQGWLRPTADGTTFAWAAGKPTEAFGKLAFDVELGPKEYLLIGPTETPAGKLGGAFFVDTADGRSRMRVLVVRGWRPQEMGDGPDAPGRRAAVAAQAGTPVVARGQGR